MQNQSDAQRLQLLSGLFRRVLLIGGCLVYCVLLVWSYIHVISPTYSYMGFTYQEPSQLTLLAAYLLALMPGLWMPIVLTRPSQVAYWLLYIVVIVPACLIPVFVLDPATLNPLTYACVLTLCFGMLGMIYWLPFLNFAQLLAPLQIPPKVFGWFIAGLTSVLILHVLSVFGLNFRFVSLLNVYSVRLDFTAQVVGQFVGYSVNWLALVISPLLIAYGLTCRRHIITGIGILISVMIYGLAAYKSVLFSSALMVIIFVATGERYRKKFGFWAVAGALVLVAGANLVGRLVNTDSIPFFLVGRILATPGLLTAYFYEFFSTHEKALLSYSIFRSFLEYPYPLVPSYLIGQVYFYDPPPQANVHLWADAFANFGYLGMLIFSILAALIMWVFDSLSKLHSSRFLATLLSVHAFTLANGALLTAIMSQGIGLTLVILFLMPRTAEPPQEQITRRSNTMSSKNAVQRKVASGSNPSLAFQSLAQLPETER